MAKKKDTKTKSAKKAEAVEEVPKKKAVDNRKLIVLYNGIAGRKASSEEEAEQIAKEYISTGKCKKADIYKLVKKVE